MSHTFSPKKELCRLGLSPVRYAMLAASVFAQGATLAITWPLWQVRESPPHLPVFDLPQFSFGVPLVMSLVLVLVRPRWGVAVHTVLLLVSFLFDQFRTQPQVIATAVLMLAAAEPRAAPLGRWSLVSIWLWSGLHKFLSPDWFGPRAWRFAGSVGLDQEQYHLTFAVAVAATETLQGLLAIVRPRWAAITCVPLHVGICVFLSPWLHNWNASVIPWNLCTVVVGGWLLWNTPQAKPRSRTEWSLAAALLVLPAGFYLGWVDHGIASVLYSDNLPRGLITTADGLDEINGWGELNVPFPNERRLLRQFFQRVAPSGSKLHIADPRPWLPDAYYLKAPDGTIDEISRERFFAELPGEPKGVGLDSRRSVFALTRAGARLKKRTRGSMIYAVQIPPSEYRSELLQHLAGLPNLEELQLAGCAVTDEDLLLLGDLPNLLGIGLENTQITDTGLQHLRSLPALIYIESAGAKMGEPAVEQSSIKR